MPKAKAKTTKSKEVAIDTHVPVPLAGAPITIAPIETQMVRVKLKSRYGSPYCCHAFTEKAIKELEASHDGTKTGRKKDPKNQWKEFIDCGHWIIDDSGNIETLAAPANQFKKSIIDAVRHVGDKKTLTMAAVRSWFYIHGTDHRYPDLIPLKSKKLDPLNYTKMDHRFTGNLDGDTSPWPNKENIAIMKKLHSKGISMRQDAVTVGMGSNKDLRYRPIIHDWECEFDLEFFPSMITMESIINLINAAGQLNGIGEWRPSAPKASGQWGRYQVTT